MQNELERRPVCRRLPARPRPARWLDSSWTRSSSIVRGASSDSTTRSRSWIAIPRARRSSGRRAIGSNQVRTSRRRGRVARRSGLAVEVDAAPRGEQLGREHAQPRTQPEVEVERACRTRGHTSCSSRARVSGTSRRSPRAARRGGRRGVSRAYARRRAAITRPSDDRGDDERVDPSSELRASGHERRGRTRRRGSAARGAMLRGRGSASRRRGALALGRRREEALRGLPARGGPQLVADLGESADRLVLHRLVDVVVARTSRARRAR